MHYIITVNNGLYARTNQPDIAIEYLEELGFTRATAWNMVTQTVLRRMEVCNSTKGNKVCIRYQ